ncbi:MAG: hypothetical protein JWR80_5426 [Bradyrhizobium sp.]|nr:hypothetical protein [Bradyrhizobium sp.]
MSDLLETAIAAHGGFDRWNSLREVAADIALGGVLWELKGQAGLFETVHFEADTHEQRATIGRFDALGSLVRFTPERLVVETDAGEVVESRENPRAAFAGHVGQTPWDRLHAAYFNAYALWTYLTQPFLYSYSGFATEEIDPWEEGGETWRRLRVVFPGDFASHTREQITYSGADGLMRRHDYAVDVLGGAMGAHYIHDYQEVCGIMVPLRRRVFPRGDDNQRVSEPVLVSIDIARVGFRP